VRLELSQTTLRFASPLTTSYATLTERPLIQIALTGDDGVTGHGEAAPLEPYDGVSVARVVEALERYMPILAASAGRKPGELLDACRAADDLPHAIAALDIAFWDLAGQRAGQPISALLSDRSATSVPVNASIAAEDRAGAAEAAAAAVHDGYHCLKVKVGVGDDAGRVAAVRAAAGPQVALRLDANGAWTVAEAERAIAALAPAGLELVEEPVRGVAATRELRERVPVRIAIDETAGEPGALAGGIADAVCLRLGRCAGIAGLLAAASLVRSTGADVYLSSTYDGPLGVAAALHAAAALRVELPCGLATLGLFEDIGDQLPVRDGVVAVPDAPGLGVAPLPTA
jgi:L-alanine-DL-glutamate epimerase-like enolase superfamily enzyme